MSIKDLNLQGFCLKYSEDQTEIVIAIWSRSFSQAWQNPFSDTEDIVVLITNAVNTNVFIFAGGRGQVGCPNVMKQKRVQTPQQRGLSSSSVRTRVQELFFGLTQQTNYPRSKSRYYEDSNLKPTTLQLVFIMLTC